MNNPNDNKNYREQQESYTDSNGNTHVKRTSETVNNSTPSNYQSGYVHGQATERGYQEERLARQDEDSTSRGLILGFLLALVGLIGGAFWYFNQNNTASETVAPASTTAPVAPVTTPTPVPTVTQQSQTRIIERTREVPVPVTKEVPVIKEVPVPVVVPQQAAPQTTTAPNININVPPQQSTTKPNSPNSSTQNTAPTKPSSNSTSTSETTNSSTTTPENSLSDTNKPATSQEPQTNVAPTSSPAN